MLSAMPRQTNARDFIGIIEGCMTPMAFRHYWHNNMTANVGKAQLSFTRDYIMSVEILC